MKISRSDLELICKIAEDAGHAIMKVYKSNFSSKLKSDDSPVTAADLAADEIIRTGLSAGFLGIPILSEESEEKNNAEGGTRTFFLVDPLDGTKEFIRRSDEFTVNIALIHEGIPIAGVVFAPALDTLYFASKIHGAWCRTSLFSEIKLCSRKEKKTSLKIIGSRSHGGQEMQAWLSALSCEYSMVTAGSSLKFCRVAEGKADVYPRLAPTSQWDTAAAQCILEAAGGTVQDLSGNPLRYGIDRPILNPSFVALGNGVVIKLRD